MARRARWVICAQIGRRNLIVMRNRRPVFFTSEAEAQARADALNEAARKDEQPIVYHPIPAR